MVVGRGAGDCGRGWSVGSGAVIVGVVVRFDEALAVGRERFLDRYSIIESALFSLLIIMSDERRRIDCGVTWVMRNVTGIVHAPASSPISYVSDRQLEGRFDRMM